MNLRNLHIKSIDRIIAHKILPKTTDRDARAETRDKLLDFDPDEKSILIDRITTVVRNANKTFQLEFEEIGDGSIFKTLSENQLATETAFIGYSKSLAHKLSGAHFRVSIPGGYLLVGSGQTDETVPLFFVIKAELQEGFNINAGRLQLIKDLFLSPAKDFYKIGLFIGTETDVIPWMYDDQFSLQKRDLTEYFYSHFLGLTTDRNDRLRSKNFYEKTVKFIDNNVDSLKDRTGLRKAVDVLFREDGSGVISPQDFSDKYLEGDLKTKYDQIVQRDFPHSFTKDISLIENRSALERISIPLSFSISITGSSGAFEHVEILDGSVDSVRGLLPEIYNGNVRKMVILKETADGSARGPEVDPILLEKSLLVAVDGAKLPTDLIEEPKLLKD